MIETANIDGSSRPAIRLGALRLQVKGQARGTEPAGIR